MRLNAFLRAVWANGLAIVAGVAISAGIVFAASYALPRSYEAEARLVVEAGLGLVGSGTDDVLNAPRVGQTYAVLATTRPVLLDVIERADLPYDPIELGRRLVVSASIDTPIMSVTMTDPDPLVAAQAANAMAAALVELATDDSVVGAAPTQVLRLVEPATPPADFAAPRPLFNSLVSGSAVLVALLLLLAAVVSVRDGRGETVGARGG